MFKNKFDMFDCLVASEFQHASSGPPAIKNWNNPSYTSFDSGSSQFASPSRLSSIADSDPHPNQSAVFITSSLESIVLL